MPIGRNMSSGVMDPAADTNGTTLVKLARLYNLPDFVKQADITEAMSAPEGGPNFFANPHDNTFPVHSAAATWLSAAYFHEQRDRVPTKTAEYIEDRLTKAAEHYRIRADYDLVVKTAAARGKKAAMPNSSYAYVWQADDGSVERYYPMTDAGSVKTAADWLHANRDRIPLDVRHTISQKILVKAAEFGTALTPDVDESLEKQAGRGMPDYAQITEALRQRAALASADMKEGLNKLADTVTSSAENFVDSADLVKLACLMEEVDFDLKLRGKYTDLIRRPEDVVFTHTFTTLAKEAADRHPLQTGNMVTTEQLSKLAASDLAAAFGDDFVIESSEMGGLDLEKLAAMVTTLPRNDAIVLEQMLAERGEYPDPRMKQASQHIPDNVLTEMALRYTQAAKNDIRRQQSAS